MEKVFINGCKWARVILWISCVCNAISVILYMFIGSELESGALVLPALGAVAMVFLCAWMATSVGCALEYIKSVEAQDEDGTET